MQAETKLKSFQNSKKCLGLRLTTAVITFLVIFSEMTGSTAMNESSYLIEPFSDQSFIFVRRPAELYKPTVFELVTENS